MQDEFKDNETRMLGKIYLMPKWKMAVALKNRKDCTKRRGFRSGGWGIGGEGGRGEWEGGGGGGEGSGRQSSSGRRGIVGVLWPSSHHGYLQGQEGRGRG